MKLSITTSLGLLALAGAAPLSWLSSSSALESVLELFAPQVESLISDKPAATSDEGFSEELQSLITKEALEERAIKLYQIAATSYMKFGHPTRVIGSTGHLETLKYIQSELESFDFYDVWLQGVLAPMVGANSWSVEFGGKKIESALPFFPTPSTPHGGKPITAKLSAASNVGCNLADFGPEVNGTVVLVERGDCPFGQKTEQAGRAGAVAVIQYDYQGEDKPYSGSLGGELSDWFVPTFGVPRNDALKLLENLGEDITVAVDAYFYFVQSYNVLAQTRTGDPENVVMLGAHSDSVAAGAGINDDGSGTNSLLEVAKHLVNFNVTNAVRFAWWTAEEEGLIGSNEYAFSLEEEENQKVRLFMDYDMMASPNYNYEIYDANNKDHPNGSEELKNLYIDYYKDHAVNYTLTPFDGRSDYDGFIRNRIPGGGVATGAEALKTEKEKELFGGEVGEQLDPCYHELCDNIDNLDYDAWVLNTQLIAHSVATYAHSLDDFPKREAFAVQQMNYQPKYQGPQLIM